MKCRVPNALTTQWSLKRSGPDFWHLEASCRRDHHAASAWNHYMFPLQPNFARLWQYRHYVWKVISVCFWRASQCLQGLAQETKCRFSFLQTRKKVKFILGALWPWFFCSSGWTGPEAAWKGSELVDERVYILWSYSTAAQLHHYISNSSWPSACFNSRSLSLLASSAFVPKFLGIWTTASGGNSGISQWLKVSFLCHQSATAANVGQCLLYHIE